jgi:hypothetical protein
VPGDHRPFAPERIEQADGKIGIEKYLLVSIFQAKIKSFIVTTHAQLAVKNYGGTKSGSHSDGNLTSIGLLV